MHSRETGYRSSAVGSKAHARIIWDACWSTDIEEEESWFATASRDKTVGQADSDDRHFHISLIVLNFLPTGQAVDSIRRRMGMCSNDQIRRSCNFDGYCLSTESTVRLAPFSRNREIHGTDHRLPRL